MQGYNLFRQLSEKKTVAPYVQASLLKESWPETMKFEDPYFHDSKIDDYFHPSTHAIYGEKALYYMLSPGERGKLPPEDRTFSRIFTPMMGSAVHTIIQQKGIHDGLWGPEDVEIALIDEKRHWKGHADLRFKGELVDLKTMNTRSFAFCSEPKNSWIGQLHPYMDAMGLDTSLVLIVEMGMPWNMKEIRVNRHEKTLKAIYEKWERVREAIANRDVPDTCCTKENSAYCPLNCQGRYAP